MWTNLHRSNTDRQDAAHFNGQVQLHLHMAQQLSAKLQTASKELEVQHSPSIAALLTLTLTVEQEAQVREASFREQVSKWLEEKKIMRMELLHAKEQAAIFVQSTRQRLEPNANPNRMQASISSAQCNQFQRVMKGTGERLCDHIHLHGKPFHVT